jgi:hypothetical protein
VTVIALTIEYLNFLEMRLSRSFRLFLCLITGIISLNIYCTLVVAVPQSQAQAQALDDPGQDQCTTGSDTGTCNTGPNGGDNGRNATVPAPPSAVSGDPTLLQILEAINGLRTDFTDLRRDFADLRTNLTTMVFSVDSNIRKFLHDSIADRAQVLLSVTSSRSCKINDKKYPTFSYDFFSSEHSVLYRGVLLTVGAKHAVCYEALKIPTFSCSSIDVELQFSCPENLHYFMNISRTSPLRFGDQASTLGFVGGEPRFWHGHLGAKLSAKLISEHASANQTSLFIADEYLFDEVTQMEGMSGSGTLNGAGYTGMVHGIHRLNHDAATDANGKPATRSYHKSAVVIPAAKIFQCADDFIAKDEDRERQGNTRMRHDLTRCPTALVLSIP